MSKKSVNAAMGLGVCTAVGSVLITLATLRADVPPGKAFCILFVTSLGVLVAGIYLMVKVGRFMTRVPLGVLIRAHQLGVDEGRLKGFFLGFVLVGVISPVVSIACTYTQVGYLWALLQMALILLCYTGLGIYLWVHGRRNKKRAAADA